MPTAVTSHADNVRTEAVDMVLFSVGSDVSNDSAASVFRLKVTGVTSAWKAVSYTCGRGGDEGKQETVNV